MTADEPGTSLVPRVATFFAAYPEPIALPDGAYFCVAVESPTRGFPAKIALHVKDGESPVWLTRELTGTLVASVRFHRTSRDRNIFAESYAEVMPVVRRVGGPSFPSLDSDLNGELIEDQFGRDMDERFSCRTVVEMTTQLARPTADFWEPCCPDDGVMGPTLTRCLSAMMLVVNAYRFAEKITIPGPARERLGRIIIAATRAANPEDGGWDTPARDVYNFFAEFSGQSLPAIDSTRTTFRMENYIFLAHIGHPVVPLMQLQADLNNAFYHDGNFRAAVIFAHSASEVLMDTAVLGMLFEEGQPPDVAAHVFDKPLKARMLTEFHERLGGAWNPGGAKPVARWLRDLLAVRHRVAHTGYAPSYDEALRAREAHFDLGSHLRDRLAIRVKNYPLTAGILVTQGGFERRDIRTKAADHAIKLAQSELLREFLEWRNETVGLRVLDLGQSQALWTCGAGSESCDCDRIT